MQLLDGFDKNFVMIRVVLVHTIPAPPFTSFCHASISPRRLLSDMPPMIAPLLGPSVVEALLNRVIAQNLLPYPVMVLDRTLATDKVATTNTATAITQATSKAEIRAKALVIVSKEALVVAVMAANAAVVMTQGGATSHSYNNNHSWATFHHKAWLFHHLAQPRCTPMRRPSLATPRSPCAGLPHDDHQHTFDVVPANSSILV